MLRDDTLAYTTNRAARRRVLREILSLEEQELGVVRAPTPQEEASRATHQKEYAQRISQPLHSPAHHFTDYLRCPRTLRGKGNRSLDTLFTANPDGTFWLYGTQKVSGQTLGPLANKQGTPPTPEEVRKSAIGAAIRRQVDSLMAVAATKQRCGLIFDLVSTSKIIASGAPHEVGAYIYEYIDETHYDKLSLKFVFVGITDNVNCCAARDVFCRDDVVAGHYVGDTKRPFDALDNVHMYTVFPGHRLHPFSRNAAGAAASNSGGRPPTSGSTSSPLRPGTQASGARSPNLNSTSRDKSPRGSSHPHRQPAPKSKTNPNASDVALQGGSTSMTFLTQSSIPSP